MSANESEAYDSASVAPIHTGSELSSDSDSAYDSASVASVKQALVLGLCWRRVRCKQAGVSNPGLIHNSPIPPPTNRKSWNEIAR